MLPSRCLSRGCVLAVMIKRECGPAGRPYAGAFEVMSGAFAAASSAVTRTSFDAASGLTLTRRVSGRITLWYDEATRQAARRPGSFHHPPPKRKIE
jgi:hypothetical protein